MSIPRRAVFPRVVALLTVSAVLPFTLQAAARLLNVDFGAGTAGTKVGPAAVGLTAADVWNYYTRDTEGGGYRTFGVLDNLLWSDGSGSGIGLIVTNADGAWPSGAADPMMDIYLYPLNPASPTITLTFTNLPAARFDLYAYAHGALGAYNSYLSVQQGSSNWGSAVTTDSAGWNTGTWQEGQQYVVFRGLDLRADEPLVITVQPGGAGVALINGLQLFERPTATGCVAIAEGLVAWWKAEDNGSNALPAPELEPRNGTTYDVGNVGRAFRLDGVDDALRAAASPALNVGTGPGLTIEGWIQPDDPQAVGPLVEWNDEAGNIGAHLWVNVGDGMGHLASLFVNLVDTTGAYHGITSPPDLLRAGAWQHVALTYDRASGFASLFVDGASVQTQNLGAFVPQTSYPLWLGRRVSGVGAELGPYRGRLDEFSLYDRALTAAEIQSITEAGAYGKCPPEPAASSALAHWSFEETNGTVAHDRGGRFDGALSASGSAFTTNGVVGRALWVDRAANGFVDMGNVLGLETNDFTCVLWMKMNPGDLTESSIVGGKHAAGYANGYFLSANNSGGWGLPQRAFFYDSDSAYGQELISTTPVNDGQWHQLVAVYRQGGTKDLYVDGTPLETSGSSVALIPNTASFLLGGYSLSGSPVGAFTGWIDEVQIYDRAVTAGEVDFLYQHPAEELPGCTAPPAGLVAWWRGESNRFDAVGPHHAAAVGDVAFAPGHVGTAISLNGTNAALRVAPTTDLAVKSLSIEGWIRPDDPGQSQPVVEWNDPAAGWGVHLWLNVDPFQSGAPQSLFANLVSNDGISRFLGSDAGLLQAGAWHHVALTYDQSSGAAALYLDGVLVRWALLGSFTPQTTYPLWLGHRAWGGPNWYRGLLDEFGIYDRALTASEIRALHAAGLSGKCPPDRPPALAIVAGPVSQTVEEGASVTFQVEAAGIEPFGYQWTFNDTALPGQTNQLLILAGVDSANAGAYAVTVMNLGGSVTSSPATLTVLRPPRLTEQPRSQTALLGGSVTLRVTATGATPLSYRWLFRGATLSGATAPILVLNNLEPRDAGPYTVRVTNADGSVTSEPAVLTIASGILTARATPGGFELNVSGNAASGYLIEVSTDLVNWEPLASVLDTPATWQFLDEAVSGHPAGFYRLRRL